jgi:hypothetical protein
MADESMVRNPSAQAEAIWPQEKALFERDKAAELIPHVPPHVLQLVTP